MIRADDPPGTALDTAALVRELTGHTFEELVETDHAANVRVGGAIRKLSTAWLGRCEWDRL